MKSRQPLTRRPALAGTGSPASRPPDQRTGVSGRPPSRRLRWPIGLADQRPRRQTGDADLQRARLWACPGLVPTTRTEITMTMMYAPWPQRRLSLYPPPAPLASAESLDPLLALTPPGRKVLADAGYQAPTAGRSRECRAELLAMTA